MTAAEILVECRRRGIELRPDGDRVRVRAPAGALDDNLRAGLREHRAELVRMLSPEERELSETAARDLDGPLPCEQCGETRPVMALMEPGPDGEPWALCSPCWREGVS